MPNSPWFFSKFPLPTTPRLRLLQARRSQQSPTPHYSNNAQTPHITTRPPLPILQRPGIHRAHKRHIITTAHMSPCAQCDIIRRRDAIYYNPRPSHHHKRPPITSAAYYNPVAVNPTASPGFTGPKRPLLPSPPSSAELTRHNAAARRHLLQQGPRCQSYSVPGIHRAHKRHIITTAHISPPALIRHNATPRRRILQQGLDT